MLLTDRGAQRAVLPGFAIDSVTLDQVEHDCGRRARQPVHPAAKIRAEIALDRIRIDFQSGIDLSAIASGRAESGVLGFEQDHLGTGLRRMQCGRTIR